MWKRYGADEAESAQQSKRGRTSTSPYENKGSAFLRPPATMAPRSTFINSNVTFKPSTASRATSVVSSHGSNYSSTSTVPINIKFCDPEQNESISFRIMRGIPLKKAMEAYCEQHNKDLDTVRFTIDGRRIKGELTPDEMGMEDGDEVDSWLDQEGGSNL